MTISRMQQPRQLYGLGSFVKSIGKGVKSAVKGVAEGVKDFAKSDAGKLALLAAAGYGLGGAKFLGGKGLFTPGQGLSRFGNLKNFALDKLLGSQVARGEKGITREGGLFSFIKDFTVNNPGKAALLGLGAAGVAAPFFFGKEDEEEVVEDPFSVTPSSISDIVAQARRRDPSLRFLPPTASAQPGFFTAAEGGTPREMFAKGSSKGGGIFSLANLIKLLNPLDPSKSNLRKTIETGSYVLPMLPFKEGGTPREMFAGGASKNRVAQLLQLLEGIEDPMDRKMIQDEIDMLLGKFAKGGIADLPKVRMLEVACLK